MKFIVELKYYGKPIRIDKKKKEVIVHLKKYEKSYKDDYIKIMQKELNEINKKYKGLYSIKFYLEEFEYEE